MPGGSGTRKPPAAHGTAVLLLLLTAASAWASRKGVAYTWQLGAVPVFLVLQIAWFRLARGREKPCLGVLLVLALVGHVTWAVVADPLYTSDDINRYVFEGHVWWAGGNPYAYPPASPMFDSLSHEEGLQTIRDGVNNNRIATIYPPLAEMLFTLGAGVTSGLRGWLMVVLAFDLLLLFSLPAILRAWERDVRWTVFYAFHPLLLLEGLGGGHIDLPAVAFLMFALLMAARKRNIPAWIFFAASIATKLIALVVGFSFLARCRWRGAFIAAALIGLSLMLCMKNNSIVTEPAEGSWRVLAGPDKGTIFTHERVRSLADGATTLSPGGRSLVTDSARSPSGKRRLLVQAELLPRHNLKWSDILGQYTIVALGEKLREKDKQTLRFDGQGRVEGLPQGRYWMEDDQFLCLSWDNSPTVRFFVSEDLQLLAAVDEGHRLFLMKGPQQMGMGFRQYTRRWTANAPIFRALQDLMAENDAYDGARRAAQKWAAAFLVVLALVFLVTRYPLPPTALWLLFALWLVAPAVYPWYLIWLVPLLGFSQSWVPLTFTYTALIMHWDNTASWDLLGHSMSLKETLVFAPLLFAPLVQSLWNGMRRKAA